MWTVGGSCSTQRVVTPIRGEHAHKRPRVEIDSRTFLVWSGNSNYCNTMPPLDCVTVKVNILFHCETE